MNLAEFEIFENGGWSEIPYEFMAQLRRERPVARSISGLFYLSRYWDCRGVLEDAATFSNLGGMRGPGVVIPPEERLLNELDPPQHTRLRKLERSTLHYRNFRAMEPYIRKLAEECISALPRGEVVDLVPVLTDPIPSHVANELIGVPMRDSEKFSHWAKEVCTSTWVTENRTERGEGLKGGHPEFAGYLDAMVAERRAAVDPPDSLITRLILAEVDGERMSDTEIRTTLAHLILGGNDTTTQLLGNLLHRVIGSPELQARLRRDREAIPAAVEESLRMDAVVQLLTRTSTRDVEISGVRVPAGARVVVGVASANRDETAFGPAADRFSVDREKPEPHLTFGFGPHYCLGANLARLAARTVINVFLDQIGRCELAPGYAYERLPGWWQLGPQSLEVVLHDRSG